MNPLIWVSAHLAKCVHNVIYRTVRLHGERYSFWKPIQFHSMELYWHEETECLHCQRVTNKQMGKGCIVGIVTLHT